MLVQLAFSFNSVQGPIHVTFIFMAGRVGLVRGKGGFSPHLNLPGNAFTHTFKGVSPM